MITNDMLNQTITTIYTTTRDGYGAITKSVVYSDIECRWQEKFEQVLDSAGNQQIRLSLTDPDSETSFVYFDAAVVVSEGDLLTIPSPFR